MAETSASEIVTRKSNPLWEVLRDDIWSGLLQWRLWTALSKEDLRQRYQRTVFGVAWLFLSFGMFVLVKVVIFERLSNVQDISFAVFLCSGFLVWQFITGSISEGCVIFMSSSNWLKGTKIPISVFIFQSITGNLVTFFFSSIIVAAVVVWQGVDITPVMFWTIPALLIFIINAVWVHLFLGCICARFRDLQHFISSVMRIMLFLTPILWVPTSMGRLGEYVWWNPFTHYLEIFREPILRGEVPVGSWIVVLCITVVGWALGVTLYALCRRKIIFWI
ncbi:ABC transporter permease [Parvularcula sp. IMCC14364]|uniref:ABC transporter permease n=1 Tax=Parvularcula sp. IMCC14364 TaxID=3067902 RepID=UPI0027416172|nr:ABC transporter permease [Parvularcula sp. IMCC14364]